VDLVILATPPGFRPIHLAAAVKAKKHVFMEKPVAVDGPGVRSVLESTEAAKKQNTGIGVGLQRRHEYRYLETIAKLQEGIIGDIHTLRVYWNGGGVWLRNREPGMSEMTYQMRNWYYFNWLCGDHICEQHIHNLDVGNWVKNAYPVSCNGMGGRQVRTGKEYGEIYDHHAVEYIFADGARMISQCRHIPNTWSSVSEYCQGSKGDCDISGSKIDVKGSDPWRYRGKGGNPYQVEHDDLFASIRAGKPLNEGEYGAKSSLTAIMGRMATYTGKIITWEEALNSKVVLAPDSFTFDTAPKSKPNADGFYPIAMPGVDMAKHV
jgi:myo-inositol 2-dehydrogenase/D-chiro-inositol 1-dehydrogenase